MTRRVLRMFSCDKFDVLVGQYFGLTLFINVQRHKIALWSTLPVGVNINLDLSMTFYIVTW